MTFGPLDMVRRPLRGDMFLVARRRPGQTPASFWAEDRRKGHRWTALAKVNRCTLHRIGRHMAVQESPRLLAETFPGIFPRRWGYA